jgi:hypothetical protein
MTTLCPRDLPHVVQTVAHRQLGYRAECRCGWAGEWTTDYSAADEQTARHRSATLGSDRLAMTLCELMDLQDDIADALMWLAENWASDLPAPRVRVRQDGRGRPMPGVALAVECESEDDADWIAMLLHDAPRCVRVDVRSPGSPIGPAPGQVPGDGDRGR